MEKRLDTCVWDILENDDDNVVYVELSVNNDIIEIEIDLEKVGLTKEMDYGFQLAKDLDNIVDNLYKENHKIPTAKEIQEEFYKNNYLVIEIGE